MMNAKILFTALLAAISMVMCSCAGEGGSAERAPLSGVYVAGFEYTAQGVEAATLWKDGTPQRLSTGARAAAAASVYVSDSVVYVAGYENNAEGIAVATLWKNGVAQPLSDGSYPASATSVFAADSNVYVAGYELAHEGNERFYYTTLWKNGEAQRLCRHNESRMHASVCVSGADVYVVGTEGAKIDRKPKAMMLQNGSVRQLSDNGGALSVFVK